MATDHQTTQPFRDLPILVGRDRERERLRQILGASLEGHGSLVLISGEAGIGKTALVQDLVSQAGERGVLVLSGGCYDLTTTPPYGPWSELVTASTPDSDLPHPAPAALQAGDDVQAATSQAALFEQARGFFASVAGDHPLVLVLEDLHWSDPASLDLLRYLARQLADLPLLLVATYRDDEITRHHPLFQVLPSLVREAGAIRLELTRLDEVDTRALVAARFDLPEADGSRLVAYLQGAAEGNPLFTGELLRSLEADGVLHQERDGWVLADLSQVSVPPLVVQVIERRLAQLDAGTRTALEVATVIGQEISFDIWNTVSGLDEAALDHAAGQALDAHLLQETTDRAGLRFSHALVREALYEGVIPTRRRIRHRQVGDALTRQPGADPDEVAYHFQRAGDSRAVEWLIRAGLRAERRYALLMAAEHFEATQALLEGDPSQAQLRGWLLLRCGWLLRWTGDNRPFAYLQESGRLAATAGDRVLAAYSLLAGLFAINWLDRDPIDGRLTGLAEMEAGVAAIDALSPADQARTETPLAQLAPDAFAADIAYLGAGEIPMPGRLAGVNYFKQWWVRVLATCGRFREAVDVGEQHIAQVRVAASDERLVQATCVYAYYGLGVAYTALGQPEDARRFLKLASEAVAALEDHGWLPAVLVEEMYLLMAYHTEQVAERRELANRASQAAHYALGGRAAERAHTTGYHISVMLLDGRWAEAREILVAAASFEATWACGMLGRLAYVQGAVDEAWAQVHGVLPRGRETAPGESEFYYAIDLQRLAVALALDAGDLPEARQWLEMHDHWLDWSGAAPGRSESQLLWARYHRAAGDQALARQHAEYALALANEPRQPLALIAAQRFLGQLDTEEGRFDEAAGHLDASLSLAELCEIPYEQALTLLAIAELRAATGNTAEVRALLEHVCAICTPLEAKPALARADALEASLGATRASYPAGLTPREVEVLRLVAEGLTDAEAAERLFVSPRTVSSHLTSVYTKLGVSTRAAATRLAVEHGLL